MMVGSGRHEAALVVFQGEREEEADAGAENDERGNQVGLEVKKIRGVRSDARTGLIHTDDDFQRWPVAAPMVPV